MNKELLANIRNILIPTLASCLKRTNYEGQGEKDAIEFTHDITEIFDLAEQQLYAQPKWIPCSERMPEDYTDVLVWFEYYRYGDYNCLYQMHGIGNYMAEYDSWMINHETGWRELRVFAWMPLPAPWKGEQNG